GTIAGGSSLDVTVTFDATGLKGGRFDANIRIANNDPDEAEIVIPVHLDVTGAPDIAISQDTLDFGPVFIGTTDSLELTVENKGTEDLLILSAETEPKVYTVSPAFAGVNPGEREVFTVIFFPNDVGDLPGTLTFTTNDPDEGTVKVMLHGQGVTPPDISVSPDSLNETLFTGETSTQLLTINNNGGSDLLFNISTKEVFSAASKYVETLSTISNNLIELAFKALKGVTRTGQRTIDGKVFTTFMESERINFQKNLTEYYQQTNKYLKNANHQLPQIAVVGGGRFDMLFFLLSDSSLVSKFVFTEVANYNVFSQIKSFDGLIISEFESEVTNARAQSINSFYNSGKPIILGMDDLDDNYIVFRGTEQLLNPVFGISNVVDGDYVWGSLNLNNPIASGISRIFQLAGWLGNDNDWYSLNGADWIFAGTDGNYYGISFEGQARTVLMGEFLAGIWQDGNGKLIVNAITWMMQGVSWISVSPDSGSVAPGSSLDIMVTFDATKLNGGDFDANIMISNNDPDEPVVTVPAHLHVTGIPDIAISDSSLDYGSVFIGAAIPKTLVIHNVGSDLLTVSDISSNNNDFSVDTTSFSLSPGDSQRVVVTFSPSSPGEIIGTLTITSDDQDEPTVNVALRGEGLVPPVIAVSPDSLSENLFTGGRSTQLLTISNTGGSDLDFEINIKESKTDSTNQQMSLVNPFKGSDSKLPRIINTIGDKPKTEANKNTNMPPATLLTNGLPDPSNRILDTGDTLNVFQLPIEGWTGLAWDGTHLWAINFVSRILYELDPSDGSIISQVAVNREYVGLVYDGSLFWSAVWPSSTIHGINKAGVVVTSFTVPVIEIGGVTWDGQYFWIVSRKGSDLYQVDRSGTTIRTVSLNGLLPVTAYWSMIWVPEHEDGHLWLCNEIDFSINQVDVSGDTAVLLKKFSFPGEFPYSLTHDGKDLWYADWNPFLYKIDDGIKEGVDWLLAKPVSGTVPANSSLDIEVNFDAAGLAGGEYNANILIKSNDPVNTEIRVPAHLTVTDAADIVVSDDTLDYGAVFIGSSVIDTLIVSNEGTAPLTVDNITSDNSDYNVNLTSFNLTPGDSQEILVTFTPSSQGVIVGTLNITSNDPDEASVLVNLHGEGLIPPDISVSPDSLSEALFTGENARQ
ncbi:MAG: choice-of-anchor D domain-containing protein, partial [bacterium]